MAARKLFAATLGGLALAGCEPFKSSPEQFAQLVRDDLPRWAKIVKDSGATVD